MCRKFLNNSVIILSTVVLIACSNGTPNETAQTAEKPDVMVEKAVTEPVSLSDILAHPRRAEEASRDQYRHPKETLKFFDVGAGKTVAEIWPGWYTNVTAPYLKENGGKYVAVLYPEGISEGLDKRIAAYKDKYSDNSVYGDIEYGSFWRDGGPILPADSVDVLLTFRNVHNWMGRGYADQAFSDFYAAIKPGGILGVVEHRLPESAVQDPKGSSGYVQESYMKDLAQRAGFEFVESSEINANPRDTADHPMGVWTLPPRSRLPEEGSEAAKGFDAQLYKNIGESDRATLKFRKPL